MIICLNDWLLLWLLSQTKDQLVLKEMSSSSCWLNALCLMPQGFDRYHAEITLTRPKGQLLVKSFCVYCLKHLIDTMGNGTNNTISILILHQYPGLKIQQYKF